MSFQIRLKYTGEFVGDVDGIDTYSLLSHSAVEFVEGTLEPYLDEKVLREGIVGGVVSAELDEPSLLVDFWLASYPSEKLLLELKASVCTQLLDGMGEGGFEFKVLDELICIAAVNSESPEIEISTSDRSVLSPNRIAIAAKDNDEVAVRNAIVTDREKMNSLFQGYSALHYSIFNSNVGITRLLLANGAAPNVIAIDDSTPLTFVAASRAVSDEKSCEITLELLKAGADKTIVGFAGDSPLKAAEIAKKPQLARVLSESF